MKHDSTESFASANKARRMNTLSWHPIYLHHLFVLIRDKSTSIWLAASPHLRAGRKLSQTIIMLIVYHSCADPGPCQLVKRPTTSVFIIHRCANCLFTFLPFYLCTSALYGHGLDPVTAFRAKPLYFLIVADRFCPGFLLAERSRMPWALRRSDVGGTVRVAPPRPRARTGRA